MTEQESAIAYETTVFTHKLHREGCCYDAAVRQFKRAFLLQVLLSAKGNQCRAAKVLQVHRNTLRRRMDEVGLKPRDVRVMCKRKRIRKPRAARRVPHAAAA